MIIKVAIVEDDAKVREGLSFLINGTSGFSCAGTYSNAEVAIKELPQDWPDVLLMDINLPKMSGIECSTKLKALRPGLQIIMLTSYDDNEWIFNSLKAGASGYLSKQSQPTEILEAIRDVRSGGSPMSSFIARKVVQYFQKPCQDGMENLTHREFEILDLLSKGYQHKEIADKLSISPGTTRNHLQNIYNKLHVRSRTEAVLKFLGAKGQDGR